MTMLLDTFYHSIGLSHTNRRLKVDAIVKTLEENFDKSVGVGMCGLSGIMLGMFVADKTERPFFILRKDKEDSHGKEVEGHFCKEYVIVDDFIESGRTLDRIIDKLGSTYFFDEATQKVHHRKCVGIVLYNNDAGDQTMTDWKGIKIFRV